MSKNKLTRRVDVIKVNIVRCEGAICISTGYNDTKYHAFAKSRKLRVDTLLLSDGEKKKVRDNSLT